MPDLKFDGKFYFSANSPSSGHPLLVPMISNPNFVDSNFKITSTPGIQELIDGDLGITEQIMNPVLKPIISAFLSNPLLVDSIASVNNLEKNNKEAISKYLMNQYIPKDLGLKPLEKTIISSMMESHKPLIEFLKIFLQTLGVAEDIACRYLGTSIKILGKEIGIKSRSPYYWDESLGYTKTITMALKDMLDATDKATSIMDKSISDKNPIKKSVTGVAKDKAQGDTDSPAYYVAYFDEDGISVDPPNWIKNSNKWFSKKIQDRNGNLVTIGAPFTQLSDNLNEGVEELKKRQETSLISLQTEKSDMLKNIQDRIKEAEKITNEEERLNEIQSLNAEMTESENVMDDLIQALNDIINGTNKAGGNYVDDTDLSKGINSPAIINEWIAKSRGSQFRAKYYPEQKSTVQTLVDKNGEALEPYVSIPKFGVNYKGDFYNIEVPLAFDNQITTQKVYSSNDFFDNKQTEGNKIFKKFYSNKNVVNALNLNPLNVSKPFSNVNTTHYSNDIKQDYIPDNIKRFYLPLEWEEVLEYDIISKSTGKVLSVENEYVPFKIDVENDYELRLIKVINLPLINGASNNVVNNIFPDINSELIIIINNNYLQFLKTEKAGKAFNISINYPSNSNSTTRIVNTTSSSLFNHGTKYVDETFFIPEKYFYLRKDTKWGKDYIDVDDSEIYQIKNINKNWVSLSDKNIRIDNTLKEIYLSNKVTIPTYISEYIYGNNMIITTTNNKNKEIKITNVIVTKTETILKYENELIDETNSLISIQYLDSSDVEVYQNFNGVANFDATIFTILDLNYLPDSIKNGDKSIIIQGLDKNSLFSTISNKVKKEGNNYTKFIQPNSDVDNIYKIEKIEKIKTRKGIEVLSLKLDYSIPKDYSKKAYSSDINQKFYYPLRIYTVPKSSNNVPPSTLNTNNDTGTIYTFNNTIPDKLKIENPNSTKHSTPDLNEQNLLKEGVIYQGLDPRYVDRNKWKVFYLVEAIKKGNDGVASINDKVNPLELKNKKQLTSSASGGGKEWYGLIDKFTASPMVISKLMPLIVGKTIPLAIKMTQLVSNPKKIKDLMLDIALTNEDISKFPKNFTAFSQKGAVGKEKELSKIKPPKSFDEYENNNKSPFYYTGPQPSVTNPKPIFVLDGQGVAEFGKGAFGKSLFTFGANLKDGEIKPITQKDNSGNTKEQSLFTMILNFVKLPFEILFKIFKWIISWIKKLLNPVKIPSALTEFLSFKWLLEILGKDSIFQIMGLKDVSSPDMQKEMDKLVSNITGDKPKELLNDVLKTIRGNNLGFVEVLVYDILKNGQKINQETIERPYAGNNNDINTQNVKNSNGSDASLNDINNTLNKSGDINNSNNQFVFCGERDFSLLKLFPVPFFTTDVSFNNCELPILFLKPLEIVEGLMIFIQNILNSFLSMPTSILGLDPTIPIPKFGKEIPFANILTEIINKLKEALVQIKT